MVKIATARCVGLVLLSTLAACGNDSRDVVGPPPGPPAPVFEFVREMIDDPWFAESLPGRLMDPSSASSIRTAIRVDLRGAVETAEVTRLNAALESLEAAVHAYRAEPGFDPAEGPAVAVFELFVDQARGIRDGALSWSPRPLLREDRG